jgi:hypothetical protein
MGLNIAWECDFMEGYKSYSALSSEVLVAYNYQIFLCSIQFLMLGILLYLKPSGKTGSF